jgi:hypothetical protein
MGWFVLCVSLNSCAKSICVYLLFRYTQPLAVSHATALFEASHRSINRPPPAAAAAACDGIAAAHDELQQQAAGKQQEVQQQHGAQQQRGAEQQQAGKQQLEAARGNRRRRSLPEEEQPPPRRSQRARTSPARQPPQPPPLRGVTPEPGEDRSRPEKVTIVQVAMLAWAICGHTGFHNTCQAHGYIATCRHLACRSSMFATRPLASSHPVQRLVARLSRCANVDSTFCAS